MKKVIIAAVAAMMMMTGAQAGWGVDGCTSFKSEKFTMKYTFPDGSRAYTNPELHDNNKVYVKIPGSPYYTFQSLSAFRVLFADIVPVLFEDIVPAKVCKIAADRFIDDNNYDAYKKESYLFQFQEIAAVKNFKRK